MATKKATKTLAKKAKKSPAGKSAPKKAKARAGGETLKLGSAAPSLTVNDLEKSLAWYCDVVGFTVEERWENAGKLMGVELRAGNVRLMIGQDDWKKGRNRKKGEAFRMYCRTTQNVDALAKGIVTRGGKLDQEPVDQPWGSRDFALTDPDGFKFTIASEPR